MPWTLQSRTLLCPAGQPYHWQEIGYFLLFPLLTGLERRPCKDWEPLWELRTLKPRDKSHFPPLVNGRADSESKGLPLDQALHGYPRVKGHAVVQGLVPVPEKKGY